MIIFIEKHYSFIKIKIVILSSYQYLFFCNKQVKYFKGAATYNGETVTPKIIHT
jgi:hypothetical protein